MSVVWSVIIRFLCFVQNSLYKDPNSKPDYRSKTLHELEKLRSHVLLLNDMLDNVDPARPERMVTGDAFDVSIPLSSHLSIVG